MFAAPGNCETDIQHAEFDLFLIDAPHLSIRSSYLPRVGVARSFSNRRARSRQAAETIRNGVFASVLETVEPDLVLADCEHHSAIIQSAAAGYKTALLSFMYFTPPGDQSPPLTTSIVPGRGWLGTPMGVRLAWALLQTRKRVSLASAALKGGGAELAPAHRELANLLGFDLNAHTTKSAFQTPWSYTLPTLLLLSAAHDFPVKPGPYQHFVGPMVLRSRRPRPQEADVKAFLEDSSAARKIYVGFGSMRHPPKAFFDHLMDVAQRNPHWKFLMSSIDPTIRSNLTPPDNVVLTAWAPQLDALEVSDCAIFHGGVGTLNECLATKTPMLVFPRSLDEKGNGARAVYHGTGLVGSFRDSVEAIEEKMEFLCSAKTVRDSLQHHHDTAFGTNSGQDETRRLAMVLQHIMGTSN